MRMIPVIAFFLLTVAAAISANTDDLQEQQSLTNQLTAYNAEYDRLTADRARLAKRSTALQQAQGMVLKKMHDYEVGRVDLDGRMAAQKKVIADHVSRGQVANPSDAFVNAYNAEAAQINAKNDSLTQEEDSLNERLGLIKAAIQTQMEETRKVEAADKDDLDRQRVLRSLMQPVVKRLRVIAVQLEPCWDAIAAVDARPDNDTLKETMHASCGSMFDGNK